MRALFWDAAVDTRYVAYIDVLAGLGLAVGGVALLFSFEAVKGRILLPRRRSAFLLGALLVFLALFVAMLLWAGPGHPRVDVQVAKAVQGAGAWGTLGRGLAVLSSFPLTLLATFLLFAWAAKRGQWREAYFVLAAGPGLAGVLVACKLVMPRFSPVTAGFFEGALSFPNDAAVLVPALVAIFVFLRSRAGRKPWTRNQMAIVAGIGMLLAAAQIVSGQAWLSDGLAGLALAGLWFSACLMAFHLIEGALASAATGESPSRDGRSLLLRLEERADAFMRTSLQRSTAWLLAIIALGVALRVASYWLTPLGNDAFPYAAMAENLLRHGTFTMPWGDVHTYLATPVPSHHYPPLYPVVLAGFFAVLGFSQQTVHVAAITSSLAALAVTYLCTRNLYGSPRALLATAIVAVSPLLVQNTGQGYSENLVLLLFVATMWAILKSLDKPWFIVWAGILAGLGYLTKSSMGYFFIVAGLGGLAWRIHWKGLKVLRDPAYLTAIAAFGLCVALWAVRNFLLFGSIDTSKHIADAYHYAFVHPATWAALTLVTFVFYSVVGYFGFLAILPWLPRLAKAPRSASEHDSGLWLAIGLPLVLTSLIDSALWMVEHQFFLNNTRYIAFVMVPIVWLLMRHVKLEEKNVRLALLVTFLFLIAGSLYLGKPSTSIQSTTNDLAPLVQPGDSVGFVDWDNHGIYRYIFVLTDNGTHERQVVATCANDPVCPSSTAGPETLNTTWVIMKGDGGKRLPSYYHDVTDTLHDSRFGLYNTLWRHD